MAIPLEERTARLTILIDPRKKSLFERRRRTALEVRADQQAYIRDER
jgi:hypothetical protein